LDRYRIFERDGFRCVYCGERFDAEALTVDHVQPRSRGGDHSDGNLVTACTVCNTRKGGRSVAAFLRDEESAPARFRQFAKFVWPRIMRDLQREIDDA